MLLHFQTKFGFLLFGSFRPISLLHQTRWRSRKLTRFADWLCNLFESITSVSRFTLLIVECWLWCPIKCFNRRIYVFMVNRKSNLIRNLNHYIQHIKLSFHGQMCPSNSLYTFPLWLCTRFKHKFDSLNTYPTSYQDLMNPAKVVWRPV